MNGWWYFIQPLSLTQILDYSGGLSPIYVGEAAPGTTVTQAGWRIKKLTYDANNNVTNVQFSPLANNFGDIWSNRASLVYS